MPPRKKAKANVKLPAQQAAPAPKKPLTAARRPTLNERITMMQEGPDELLVQLLDEFENLPEYSGFRHASFSVQSRQDRHLKTYRHYISYLNRLPPDTPDDEVDRIGFPEDTNSIYKLVKFFLMFVYRYARPRSSTADKILYSSLAQYRDSIMFWTLRTYRQREATLPNRNRLHNAATEGMRLTFAQFGGSKQRNGPLVSIGLEELRQLLDQETLHAYSIELSEQHQAIWNILRQTAVRPGSIGRHGDNKAFLQWQHISFNTVANEPGKFSCVINFHNLKTNSEDPERALRDSAARVLQCFLDSPSSAENIIFSVPHRLLLIALRRDLIVGITTIEQLLNSKTHNIMIKSHAKEHPVFYKGIPGGRGLDTTEAISSAAISAYIADRGISLGYTQRLSAYGFRRKSATDLVDRVGYDLTREIMGHSPETRTLERYYVNNKPYLQLTSLALAEPAEASGRHRRVTAATATLAIGRLEEERIAKLRGSALNAMVDTLAASDPNFPTFRPAAERKLYMRRMRRVALRTMLQSEKDEQDARITSADVEQRILLAASSKFAETVLKNAREALSKIDDQAQDPDDNQEDDPLDNEFDELNEDEDPNERDAELAHETSNNVVVRPQHSELSSSTADKDIPYIVLASSFMHILYDNSMSSNMAFEERPAEERRCRLCVEDDSMPEKMRAKVFTDESQLRNHMASPKSHSPYAKWKRRQRSLHTIRSARLRREARELRAQIARIEGERSQSPTAREYTEASSTLQTLEEQAANCETQAQRWACPYCKEDEYTQSALRTIIRHIQQSTIESHGPRHDTFKTEDGWYDDKDFYGRRTMKMAKATVQQQKKRLQDFGFEINNDPELLEPGYVDGVLVRGRFTEVEDILAHHHGAIKHGGDPTNEWGTGEIPPNMEDYYRRGDAEPFPDSDTIPEYMEQFIRRGHSDE